MKYKCLVFFLLLVFIAGCGKNLQQTPQSTIKAFIQNVAKLNETSPITIKQAKAILKTLFSTEKAYEAFSTTFRNIEIEDYKIGKAETKNSSALVPVMMKTKGLITTGKEEEKEYTFNLEKENGKWYIEDIAGILQQFEKKPVQEQKEEEN